MSAKRRSNSYPVPPRLTSTQVSQVLKLQHALHRRAIDGVQRKQLLLEGLCGIVGADRAVCIVSRMDDRTGERLILSVTRLGIAVEAEQPTRPNSSRAIVVTPEPRTADAGSPRAADLLEADAFGPCIDSLVLLSGLHVVAWLAVGRPHGDPRRFTPQERALIQMIHDESAWIYADELVKAKQIAAPPPLPGRRPRMELTLPGRNGTPAGRPLPGRALVR